MGTLHGDLVDLVVLVDAVRRVLETAADPDPAKGRQAYMKLGADISPLSRREALKHLG